MAHDNDLLTNSGQYANIKPSGALHYITKNDVDINAIIARECSVFVTANNVNLNAEAFSEGTLQFEASEGNLVVKK